MVIPRMCHLVLFSYHVIPLDYKVQDNQLLETIQSMLIYNVTLVVYLLFWYLDYVSILL